MTDQQRPNRKPIDPIGDGVHWLTSFVRRNLIALLFATLVVFQFLTWRAIVSLDIPQPCGDGSYNRCYVNAEEIGDAVARALKR